MDRMGKITRRAAYRHLRFLKLLRSELAQFLVTLLNAVQFLLPHLFHRIGKRSGIFLIIERLRIEFDLDGFQLLRQFFL